MTAPADLELVVELHVSAAADDVASAVLGALRPLGSGELATWRSGAGRQGTEVEEMADALRDEKTRAGGVALTTSTQSGVVVSAGDPWTVWYRPPADADAATLGAWMHGCPQAIRELAANPHFGAATLTRTPSREFACVPAPPVARWHHVIAFPVATADEAYPQAVSFWSRWDGWEDAGTVRLAWRALDATTDEDWARAVLADQMALARAARPGTTEWPPGGGMDWADMLLSREGHGLEPVGYLPDERLFELAGYFDVDEHVPLRDVLTIRALLAAGQTSDGHALETVRVTFADLRTARAEGVPLVDAGAQVAYVDDAGQVLTLDDDAF